jgi:hypothetical protein
VLAGCGGGGPHLARQDAAPLIELADKISREGPCAQARDIRALRARATALINGQRVPSALQEPLSSGVNALIEPPCLPAVPVVTVPPPRPATAEPGHRKRNHKHENHKHENHKHENHGQGKGDD